MMKVDREKFARFVLEGRRSADIAQEFGVAESSVRRIGKELGLARSTLYTQSIRERALEMRPQEAVEYLLECLYLMNEAFCGPHAHEIDGWPIKRLTPAQRRLLIALVDAAPGLRTKEQLHAAMAFGSGRETQLKLVDVVICKLRKILPPAFGRIETVRGLGYRFIPADKPR